MALKTYNAASGTVDIDMSNGNGYRLYTPSSEHGAQAAITFDGCPSPRFAEMTGILCMTERVRSVLVTGEPGSGKSNLIRDIEGACVERGVPSLRLGLHINSGKRQTIPHTQGLLHNFSEGAAEGRRSLLIIDNADYIAYANKSRPKARAAEYGRKLVPAMIDAMDGPGVITLGTSHTAEWQKSHWRWSEPDIDAMQDELLDNFNKQLTFEGELAATGLRKILESRMGCEHPLFRDALEKMVEVGVKNFHLANHLDPALLLQDPPAAIAAVHAGRESRMRIASA